MRHAFAMSLVVAFVCASVVADRSAGTQRIITGMVTQWRAGEFIVIASDQVDPRGFSISLRNTVYEGDVSAVQPGVSVVVWFRSIGEGRPVADRVRVIDSVTP